VKAYPTIVALSSGAGRAGVAVVRVSGERTRFALETIAGAAPEARKAAYRALRDRDGAVIDHGLVLFFPAPASFTGEDVAEFHVHGSRAVLSRLLSVLTALSGLRLAEAGEFTRRAFEAGKLDLAAVEGLADLIDSETEWQRKQALRQMEGALGQAAGEWRRALVKAMTLLEAEIDFSDEGDVGGPLIAEAAAGAQEVLVGLQVALGSFAAGERVREGFVVVLAGPPNAGKSSLLNALARRDVAIVSPIAGTTRDAIEVRLDLGGIPVVLVDTAGLRDSGDEIEAEGVRRARQRAAHADLVLRLRSPDSEPERHDIGTTEIGVATKLDLGGSANLGEVGVSTVSGAGLPELIELIASRLGKLGQAEPALVTRERQRVAVADAAAAIERAIRLPHEQAELIAEELRLAVRALERLIGKVDVEDVLDSLFSGFCIGK
jgi:tRNA modification GTPase